MSSVEAGEVAFNLCPLKPIAPIRHPPRHKQNRNGRPKRPPEWQQNICQNAEQHENHPEYLSLHEEIVCQRAESKREFPATVTHARGALGRFQVAGKFFKNYLVRSGVSPVKRKEEV
jgi:hypothetical protein